jgi:hypothetical protein
MAAAAAPTLENSRLSTAVRLPLPAESVCLPVDRYRASQPDTERLPGPRRLPGARLSVPHGLDDGGGSFGIRGTVVVVAKGAAAAAVLAADHTNGADHTTLYLRSRT